MLVEVRVGVIGRAHGIRGDVSVDLRTDDPDVRFAAGAVLREENGRRAFTVDSARWHSGRFLVRFVELADRTQAEQARGAVLVVDVDPADRPDDPDELYDRQLVGLRVLDAAGTDRGAITQVLHAPGQDLLEVTTAAGARLVPFVAEIVVDVDLDAGAIRLADLPGMLDDVAEPADLAELDDAAEPADDPVAGGQG